MQLKLHGVFPVEAVTIPPLKVVAYHSAPRDHHHWIVSQVMKDEVAYPVVTGLTKQDAKTLATSITNVLCTGVHDTKWWQCYPSLEHLEMAIGELVFEIMASGVSDETKQRFTNTGEIVTVSGNKMLLWNTDTIHMTPLNVATGQYDRSKPMVSRWVFTMENEVLVKKTIPEVWVQEALAA